MHRVILLLLHSCLLLRHRGEFPLTGSLSMVLAAALQCHDKLTTHAAVYPVVTARLIAIANAFWFTVWRFLPTVVPPFRADEVTVHDCCMYLPSSRNGRRPHPQMQHQLQRAVSGDIPWPHWASLRPAVEPFQPQPVPILQC